MGLLGQLERKRTAAFKAPQGQTCQQPSNLGQGQERKLPASGGLKDEVNNGKEM